MSLPSTLVPTTSFPTVIPTLTPTSTAQTRTPATVTTAARRGSMLPAGMPPPAPAIPAELRYRLAPPPAPPPAPPTTAPAGVGYGHRLAWHGVAVLSMPLLQNSSQVPGEPTHRPSTPGGLTHGPSLEAEFVESLPSRAKLVTSSSTPSVPAGIQEPTATARVSRGVLDTLSPASSPGDEAP